MHPNHNNSADHDASCISDVGLDRPVEAGDVVALSITTVGEPTVQRGSLLEFQMIDREGRRVAIPGWPATSDAVGEYRYLRSGPGKQTTVVEMVVPEGAVRFKVNGHLWRPAAQTRVIGDPSVVVFRRYGVSAHVPGNGTNEHPTSSFVHHVSVPPETEAVSGTVRVRLGHDRAAAHLFVDMLDERGELLAPSASLPVDPIEGPTLAIRRHREGAHSHRFELSVPARTRWLRFRGAPNRGDADTSIIGGIETSARRAPSSEIRDFLRELPSDAPLMVIDTTAPPLGHPSLSLRPNNLTAAFERLGVWVIFLPFGSLQEYPSRISRRVLQVGRADADLLTESVLSTRRGGGALNTYICSSFPSVAALAMADELALNGWQIVYEARDDMEEFNRVGYSRWYSPALERRMLGLAHRVVSVSEALDEKLVSLVPTLEEHIVVPNAVNRSVIDAGEELRTPASYAGRDTSSVVGYVGHLTASWFDWGLLRAAAERLPEVTFEIVGHGAPEVMDLPANVLLLGPRTHEELLTTVKRWKVGIIPFLDIPLTRSVDPNKIYEYFAWGLRCVSAPMGQVELYPSTYVYRGVDDFVTQVTSALSRPWTDEEIARLEVMVQSSDWDARARALCSYYGIQMEESHAA